jgi:hypothetical protein
LNSFGGGKFRFSSKRTSMALSAMVRPPLIRIYLEIE